MIFTPGKEIKKSTFYKNIGTIGKSYSFTFEIKLKGKVKGWSNVAHVLNKDGNCCSHGQRIPAIFVYSDSSRIHVCSSVDNNGNFYVDHNIPMGEFVNVTVQQAKRADQKYM